MRGRTLPSSQPARHLGFANAVALDQRDIDRVAALFAFELIAESIEDVIQ